MFQLISAYYGNKREGKKEGMGRKAETRKHRNHRSHARMQNCGSIRAEACSDRVNTPRIVSFSKARMFHESRSSAIPFYLLFRNSGTRQQWPRLRTTPQLSRALPEFFNNISNASPRVSISVRPVSRTLLTFDQRRNWIYIFERESKYILVQRPIKFIMPRVALFRDVWRWKRRSVVADKWQSVRELRTLCRLSGIL